MTAPSTTIRRATAADIGAVGRMGARLLRLHYDFDPARFVRPGSDAEEGYARFLGTQLAVDDSLVLVAERDMEIVGYLYAAIEPHSWKELRDRAGFVHDVFVDAPSRGTRIAEDLMNVAFDWMHEKKVPRVLLGTAAANAGALRLFRRLGFRDTMIEMTKELG
jgi:ribosomal protein S18 acetylase RimI-like enzyme